MKGSNFFFYVLFLNIFRISPGLSNVKNYILECTGLGERVTMTFSSGPSPGLRISYIKADTVDMIHAYCSTRVLISVACYQT